MLFLEIRKELLFKVSVRNGKITNAVEKLYKYTTMHTFLVFTLELSWTGVDFESTEP